MKTIPFIILISSALIWGIIVAQTKIQINNIENTQKIMFKEMEHQNYCITPKIPCKNAQ